MWSLCLLSFLTGSGLLQAQGLDSHTHGEAELNIVLAGKQLQAEFMSPAMNLLGFERAPATDDETALLNSAITVLLESGDWLFGNSVASCTSTTQEFEAPIYEEAAHEHDDNEHEHEHESDQHDHGSEAAAHADFRVQYLYDCSSAPARELKLVAFENYTGIATITVQWIVERQQGRAVLTAANPVLTME